MMALVTLKYRTPHQMHIGERDIYTHVYTYSYIYICT